MSKKRYSVYVIELNRRVWTESAKFRAANPQYNGIMECLYVGVTSKSPAVRFKQHKEGYRMRNGVKISNYFAEKYGLYLRPSLVEDYDVMDQKTALLVEKELSLALRRKRYAVWFN